MRERVVVACDRPFDGLSRQRGPFPHSALTSIEIAEAPDRSQFAGERETGTMRRQAVSGGVEGDALRRPGGCVMDDDGAAGHGEEQDRVELIELSLPEIVRVRPRRARLAAIAIGAFTGLTCLGLASSMVAPRILDRRFDPGGHRRRVDAARRRLAGRVGARVRAAARRGDGGGGTCGRGNLAGGPCLGGRARDRRPCRRPRAGRRTDRRLGDDGDRWSRDRPVECGHRDPGPVRRPRDGRARARRGALGWTGSHRRPDRPDRAVGRRTASRLSRTGQHRRPRPGATALRAGLAASPR